MSENSRNFGAFSVGDWLVEPDLDRITRDSVCVGLRPQVMEVLEYLARVEGRVVSNDELLDKLWPGRVVTDSTVYNCVGELRRALSDGEDLSSYIETVPKKGYRLIAPVSGLDGSAGADVPLRPSPAMKLGVGSAGTMALLGAFYLGSLTGGVPLVEGSSGRTLPLHLEDVAQSSMLHTFDSAALLPDGRQIAAVGYDGTNVHLYLRGPDAASGPTSQIEFGIEEQEVRFHEAPEAIAFTEYLIELTSREDQVDFDTFIGSGTSGVAADKSNRQYTGFEVYPESRTLAVRRADPDGSEKGAPDPEQTANQPSSEQSQRANAY